MNEKTVNKKFTVGNEELGFVCDSYGAKILAFYKDEKNLLFYAEDDISHSGIPLCFPSFGPLEDNQFQWQGQSYEMKQHGFVRDQEFELLKQNESSLSLVLRSSSVNKERYPFDFEFIVTYSLEDGELVMNYNFKNLSDEVLPLAPGIHPYFAVDDPSEISFFSNAFSVNNNLEDYAIVSMSENENFELIGDQAYRIHGAPDMHILGHMNPHNKLNLGSAQVEMIFDPSLFRRFTIWRKSAEVPYICFEPANEKNALNTNAQMIEPGQAWQTRVTLK
jgi:galactose mutarotase-like enzyme